MLQWLGVNLLLLIGAYLLGSFPTGYLLGRWLKGIDIREEGSGSTGATNVLRVLGKGPGAVVLGIDVLKGALAILGVGWVYSQSGSATLAAQVPGIEIITWQPWMTILAGMAALLGHSKPIWLNFRGGKSVASGLGILFALDWRVALACLGVFALTLAITRWVSLGSVLSTTTTPLWFYLAKQPIPYILLAILGGVYVVWRHQSNIQRLLAGTEPKLGSKEAGDAATSS
jgi:glycerol-3-phosphate acyltransferase PlsY